MPTSELLPHDTPVQVDSDLDENIEWDSDSDI